MRHILEAVREQGQLFGLPRRNSWEYLGKAPKPKKLSKTPPKSKQFILTQGSVPPEPLPKKEHAPAKWDENFDEYRITVEKKDPMTGETKQIKVRMAKCEITVSTYGREVTFRKTNRGHTIYDSRFPKLRRQPEFVRGELRRMLGEIEGERAFGHLTTL